MPYQPSGSNDQHRVLVFEPDGEGHAQEWLQYLIDQAVAMGPAIRLCIVAPKSLCLVLHSSLPPGSDELVVFRALSARELAACTHRVLSLAAIARWWAMRRHLRRSRSSAGFFLSLDLLCLPLAMGLRAGGVPLSGILFRTSVHYDRKGATLGERLRDARKDALYRLMLRNPAVDRVLSLDASFSDYAVRAYSRGCKVEAIVDPVSPPGGGSLPAADDGLGDGRVRFLLFGYLTERKGPLSVLLALERLPEHIASRIAVTLAGRVDPGIEAQLEACRKDLAERRPDLVLRIDNRRLDRSELEASIVRCDVVLAPYQRFIGSSGVLLWAARVGRPVLAQEYGLVGSLTRKHRLGLTVDASNVTALSDAIVRMVEEGPRRFIDTAAAQLFVELRTPQRFARAVYAALLHRSDIKATARRSLVTIHRRR